MPERTAFARRSDPVALSDLLPIVRHDRLIHSSTPEREPTEGSNNSEGPGPNPGIFPSVLVRRVAASRGGASIVADEPHRADVLAAFLAERLNDWRSYSWYRFVAFTVSEEIIWDALKRILDVPANEIRRSQGALFTSIIGPHVPGRRGPGRWRRFFEGEAATTHVPAV